MILHLKKKSIRIAHLQVYKVKGRQEYLYVTTIPYPGQNRESFYDAYTNVGDDDEFPSCGSSVSAGYLRDKCTPVSQRKMPAKYQKHLFDWLFWASAIDHSYGGLKCMKL